MEPTNLSQRHSLDALQRWEKLAYGMFIHYGMSTFVGAEKPTGNEDVNTYNPEKVDVEQWIAVARDAGMKYAVLTTKHVAGHCLWPSKYNNYNVAFNINKTDVVEAFVNACRKCGLMPGFYYCSWDNHNKFGSRTPGANVPLVKGYTTREYHEFQTNQVTELLTQYGEIGEMWIDIPYVLPRFYRQELYDLIARLQPQALVMMNNGFGDGTPEGYMEDRVWPSDLIAIERWLPNSGTGHVKIREIEGKTYYTPGEVCDPIGKEWFFIEGDVPRSDAELLGMYLISRSRGANLLLNVPPDKTGVIPKMHVDALMRLNKNIQKFGVIA